jgi:Ser-tRNA(Ala) deacylase AlaX
VTVFEKSEVAGGHSHTVRVALAHRQYSGARHYWGVMTGCQLDPDRSRIDFKLPAFARDQLPELEARVNEIIAQPFP